MAVSSFVPPEALQSRLGRRFAPWPVPAAGTLLEKIEATDLELRAKSSKAAPDSSKVGRYSRRTAEALSPSPPIAAQAADVKGRAGTVQSTDNDPESTPPTPAETPAANRRRGPTPTRDSRTRFIEKLLEWTRHWCSIDPRSDQVASDQGIAQHQQRPLHLEHHKRKHRTGAGTPGRVRYEYAGDLV